MIDITGIDKVIDSNALPRTYSRTTIILRGCARAHETDLFSLKMRAIPHKSPSYKPNSHIGVFSAENTVFFNCDEHICL